VIDNLGAGTYRVVARKPGYVDWDRETPVAPNQRAELTIDSVVSLLGTWRWTCCGASQVGQWEITSQSADGTFSGRFTESIHVGNFEGRLSGDRITFTRRWTYIYSFQQEWKARLLGSGPRLRLVEGKLDGSLVQLVASTEFEAERIDTRSR